MRAPRHSPGSTSRGESSAPPHREHSRHRPNRHELRLAQPACPSHAARRRATAPLLRQRALRSGWLRRSFVPDRSKIDRRGPAEGVLENAARASLPPCAQLHAAQSIIMKTAFATRPHRRCTRLGQPRESLSTRIACGFGPIARISLSSPSASPTAMD